MTVGKDVFKCFSRTVKTVCRGDVRRQAIPDSRCSYAKETRSPTVFSLERRTTSLTRRRLESLA